MEDRLFIESFEGDKGTAEVYELHRGQPLGVEKVDYEVDFAGDTYYARSIGEASLIAAELSGDRRFVDAALWAWRRTQTSP